MSYVGGGWTESSAPTRCSPTSRPTSCRTRPRSPTGSGAAGPTGRRRNGAFLAPAPAPVGRTSTSHLRALRPELATSLSLVTASRRRARHGQRSPAGRSRNTYDRGGLTAAAATATSATAGATTAAPTRRLGAGRALPRTNVRYAFADRARKLYVLGGVSNGTRIPTTSTATTRRPTIGRRWPRSRSSERGRGPCGALWNGKMLRRRGRRPVAPSASTTSRPTPGRLGAARPIATAYGYAAGALNDKVYVIGGIAAPTHAERLRHRDQHMVDGEPRRLRASSWPATRRSATTCTWSAASRPPPAANSTATMRLDMTTGTWSSGSRLHPGSGRTSALASAGTKLYAIGGDAERRWLLRLDRPGERAEHGRLAGRQLGSLAAQPAGSRGPGGPGRLQLDRPGRRRDLVDGRDQRG